MKPEVGKYKIITIVVAIILYTFVSMPAFGETPFIANTLGDHGNITVMEVIGNYDANNPDGSVNADPRRAIAKEFYRLHKDEYDFLVIFTNFDFTMPETEALAFYTGVKNDTKGIGKPPFDNSASYGSNSKLQGTIDMGSISKLAMDPLDPRFEEALDTISHEMMHRWATYVRFKDALGNLSPALLGRDGSHWSFLLSTDASLMYGNTWQDNGNGTFTSVKGRKYYSPLDLYLMGFIDKSQVLPMLLIDNPDVDPKRVSEMGVTIPGAPRYITIDDIIAAEGERVPGTADAPKSFKTAFIFITAPGTYRGDELYGLENIRNGWLTRYSVLTDGAGLVQVTPTLITTPPVNPGVTPPMITPRTLPSNIYDGISWLMNNQQADGSWMDLGQTVERDTAEAVVTLKLFDNASQKYTAGLQWLNGISSVSIDYLSRQLEALDNAGQESTPLVNILISMQNEDGGWGSAQGMTSTSSETSLVLRAFAKAGYVGQSVISNAVAYLKAHQGIDNGWGTDEGSRVETTAKVLSAFNAYKGSYQLNDQIAAGTVWLIQHQNPDGGFGNSPSTIYDTALAAMTLAELAAAKDPRNNALGYIKNHQSENGSWNGSSYQTALAVQAIYKDNVDPDLSLMNTDLSFVPSTITTYPATIEISAAISNLGTTSVPLAKVVLYDGAIAPANKISEQTSVFPGLSSVAMKFAVTVTDAREHTYYIAVDPDNLIKESDKTNNTAFSKLESSIKYDFEILPADLMFSQNPVDISKDVKITARISNRGRQDAFNVHVKYYIDEPGAPFYIATATIDIPAGTTVTNEIIWKTNKSGTNLPITVYIDPLNEFDEITKANNRAVALITVNESTDPNLSISYKDITVNPSTANEGGNEVISAVVKNSGYSTASNIAVNFYLGNPVADGVLLGTRTISTLNPGESATLTSDWNNIKASGIKLIYVKVDPDGLIEETTKDDNDAFIIVQVLSLPDLAISTNSISFNPAAPKDGETVSINVMIKNLGEQTVTNVLVRIYDGSNLIDSRTVPVIGGNSQSAVTFSYDTTGKSGVHHITAKVDPDNAIIELSKDNNISSKTFGVQNANMWLTEAYISPNGDGVKDSTQFFFRLTAPQTVKVGISNSQGDIVRTFQGAEFINTASGSATWDGLNSNGSVVADGQYQILVTGTADSILGSLLIVVDNNRSSLIEAIGTKYFLNNNLTCMLPDAEAEWFPNESGLTVTIPYPADPNTPEYQPGLHTMAPDGEDILRLLPPDWTGSTEHKMSPNGEHIAVTVRRDDPLTNMTVTELWTMNPDGKGLTLLESKEFYYADYYGSRIDSSNISWSPGSKSIAYATVSDSGISNGSLRTYDLWIVDTTTLQKTKIDSNSEYALFTYLRWSGDSSQIVYLISSEIGGGAKARINDLTGNKRDLIDSNQTIALDWLGKKIMVIDGYYYYDEGATLWLLDPAGNETPLKSPAKPEIFTLSPDKKHLAFVEHDARGNSANKVFVKVVDDQGNIFTLNESAALMCEGYCDIDGLLWSPDGKNLIFVDNAYRKVDRCFSEPNLIVVNVPSGNKNAIKIFNSEFYWTWGTSYCFNYNEYPINRIYFSSSMMLDNDNILLMDDVGYFVINTVTGERAKGYLPIAAWTLRGISPLGRYITYNKNVDESSICYGRGNSDIWAMSSLLNLTADLRAVRNKSSITLRGIAADLNFYGYILEYSDVKTPDVWTLLSPPADAMVLNSTFTTWVPPYEGIFYVRLTVRDKAGNMAVDRKRISWGLSSSIANLYISTGIFSPNNDGVKDNVSLNYTILEPVHLEFNVYDSKGISLKKFYRDHVAPGADRIIWDGTDDFGRIVPDGLYTIKVFDYEFFVEVDTTPPDVNLALSELGQNNIYQDLQLLLVVNLTGHAYDKNLMSWVVEYGEGDNPQTWTEYSRGGDLIGAKDKHGEFITDPIEDVSIKEFLNQEIVALTGMRFRITVEDSAGNKSGRITSVMEEKMLLYSHSWGDSYPLNHEYFSIRGDEMYPALEIPQRHLLEGIETLRVPLSSVIIQYWSGLQWHDTAQTSNYTDGEILIDWDRFLVPGNIGAVRIKAVDIYGYEHYSNTVMAEPLFFVDPCAPPQVAAQNFLFEKLTLLKLQIISSQDERYAQWTDYSVSLAPNIPTGKFSLAPFPQLNSGMGYHFRMIGIDESGKEHIGDELDVKCESTHALGLKLAVQYAAEAGCGLSSDGRTQLSSELISTGDQRGLTMKSLSYYMKNQSGLQFMRTFDLTREALGVVDIDTATMPEGLYPLQARLTYSTTASPSEDEVSGSGTLIVDRIQPEAKITYPGKALTVCPLPKSDAKGKWSSVPIEGIAQDNTIVRKYELYYGFGETPDKWFPALTRKITEKGVETVPITGGRTKGKLGDWYVEGIHGVVTIKLKVIDIAGNTTCDTISFIVKDEIEIAGLTADKQLFSPNGDSVLDSVSVDYRIDEFATVDVKVFSLIKGSGGELIPATTSVKTIAMGIQHLEGTESIVWDGTDDSGGTVADGMYGIAIIVTDTCGNKNSRFVSVEVDNTSPVVQIAYPGPSDPIGTIVEIKGTADDPNFRSYILEAASANSPDVWRLISSQTSMVKNGILGSWNTFDFGGIWTLRLTAYDSAGNSAVTTVTINLGTRTTLIRNLVVLPKLFSPNNDGKLDSAEVRYELTDACAVSLQIIDAGGLVLRNYVTSALSAGVYSYVWNGKDDSGTIVPDGVYSIKMVATLASNSSVSQAEAITVAVDTTAPLIDIKQPIDGSYIRPVSVMVNGTISDMNLSSYSISLIGDSGIAPVDSGNQNRINYTFGILDGLSEGVYTLNIKAKDLAENLVEKNISFTIDRTPPKALLNSPKDGEIYGNNRNLVNITVGVIEKNLDSYAISWGAGDNPTVWNTLAGGNTVPQVPGLFDWKVGRADSIPDGLYTLLLYAKDKAELSGEARVKIMIDNTSPEVSFASPKEGDYIKAPMDIKGNASDTNLQKYTLELSDGQCASAYKWAPLKVSAPSVKDGVLSQLQILPPDGNYCLRLTAIDRADNSAETKINIRIDTVPPAAPVLAGKIENRSDGRFTWQANNETDLAGYDLYRDGRKVNAAIIKDLQYLDSKLSEATYTYYLKAIDLAGNESKPSSEVKLKIDLTGPDAKIRSPQDSNKVSGILDIKGTAYSSDDFKEYRIYIGKGTVPDSWALIRKSPVPIPYGTLAQWDTLVMAEGTVYSIRLDAEDLSGNISTSGITVFIDNTPPAAPALISAVPNLADVALAWRANTEQDLIGYLLYRNDQLANVSGIVAGNLKPYLMTGTTYLDKALPDGKYRYSLIAMDQAGNLSDQSNAIELTIDTHPPHLTIVSPTDKSRFDKLTSVRAESTDIDISAVQFQYKEAQAIAWVNLGGIFTKQPYVINLDPATLNLAYGDCNVRAVAMDIAGNIDPSPSSITLTYIDITPPGNIQNLKATVNGKDVTLSWTADTDTDLDGYSVYRISGSVQTKLNAAPIKEAFYHDNSLSDGDYAYEVTASDKTGNETKPSNQVTARIHAPVITQPYTPVGNAAIQLSGGNAIAGSSVEMLVDRGSGPVSQGSVPADAAGQFIFSATLEPGLNKFTAKAADSAGNVSRVSDMCAVVFSPAPAAPIGLAASVSNQDAALSWNANSEVDLAGYNIFRDGTKLNSSETVTPATGSASAAYYNSNTYRAENALDQNPSTCWMSNYGYYGANQVSYEIGLSSPELINGLDIQWLDAFHAALVYEIQAWSGYAWITVNSMYNPWLTANHVEIRPSYRTDKLRINITKTTDNRRQSNPVGISEITVNKDNLLTGTSYNDPGLQDGHYSYTLSAVNYYGFESQASTEAKAGVGDVTPPAAPFNLTASVSGNNISLGWTANIEPDLAGYNIYRLMPEGWVKLNNSILMTITYTDAVLPNGTYTYRVNAVDLTGNESQPSSEASAVVFIPGTIVPVRPMIYFPTLSGLPVVSQSGRTNVSGSAIPDSIVALYKDGSKIGETQALGADSTQSDAIDSNSYGEVLSPDGKMLLYVVDGILLLQDINTVSAKQIGQNAYSGGWSPEGDRFAYYTDDGNGKYHIVIYEVQTGGITPLTDDIAADESTLTWAPDGRSIAFSSTRGGAYNIWLKDLTSGTLSQLTNGGDVFSLKFSPDGNRLAYFVDSNLYVLDLAAWTTTLVDSQTDYYSVDWSPDGSAMVFISYKAGNGDIYTFNTGNQGVQQITHLGIAEIYQPFWTPDGQILFSTSNGSTYSIGTIPVSGQGQVAIIRDNLLLNYLDRIKSGAIVYKDNNSLNVLYLAGHFVFTDVELSVGNNQFAAIASDSSGSAAQLSDDISVAFDTSLLPDLEMTAEDIYLYPLVPVAGQQLGMNLVVWNRGLTKAGDVEVAVYLSDSKGNTELLKTAVIPNIDPGSAEVVSVPWDTTGNIGSNSIIGVADPLGKIIEKTKDNNYAVKNFFVVANEGISMTTTLNNNQLKVKENLHIDAILINSGIEKAGTLEVSIEDDSGYLVTQLTSNIVQFPYGYQGHTNLPWNTGVTNAGQYRVHSVLKDSSGILAENIVPFTILPDVLIGASLVTDKAQYGPKEDVGIRYTIENRGTNNTASGLKASVRLVDQSGEELFSEAKDVGSMLPGTVVDLGSIWNTGLNLPGNCTVSLEVRLDGEVVSTNYALFKIASSTSVTGSIKVTPAMVIYGSQVVLDYFIGNTGNSAAAGLGLSLIVLEPSTQTVVKQIDETLDIPMNGNIAGQAILSSQGYALKTYVVALQDVSQSPAKNLANATFTVIDGTAPSVTLMSPLAGKYYNGWFDLSVLVTDDLSGVDKVQYQIDSGVWQSLASADPLSGRYIGSWTPSNADEGPHTISFRATDRAGNTSNPVSVSITVDLTSPQLSVATLPDNSWTGNEVMNIAGSVTDAFGIDHLTVNNMSFTANTDGSFSYVLVLKDGPNTITVAARDLAGNQTTDIRTINLDRTAPVITINSPADNIKTKLSPTDLSGSVDEQSTVTVKVNGGVSVPAQTEGGSFSLPIALTYGINTIEVMASDQAGNTATAKRTVTFDDRNPSLAVTDPGQDVKTNQANMTIRGEVSDITAVTVTITMDDNTYAPFVTAGKFEQPVTFTTEKTYQLYVKAANEVGSETMVQRNVIFDKTPPSVTIDPFPSLSNLKTRVLTGTTEPGTVVNVTCSTAAIGILIYPTSSTWTVVMTDLQEGNNTIVVTAVDDVGNSSLQVRALIQVDTMPPASPVIVSPVDGSVILTDMVDISGKAEPGALVQMVSGSTLSTKADALTGDFVFSQFKLLNGQNTLIFNAVDAAGNTSGQTLYSLSLATGEQTLRGGITVKPGTVYQGNDVALLYSITNPGQSDLNGLIVRAIVSDPAAQEVRRIFEIAASVPGLTTKTGVFSLSTIELIPTTYKVDLEISYNLIMQPRTLASATFEVKPGLEITRTIPDVRNLLVWINDGCGARRDSTERSGQLHQQDNASGDDNTDSPQCMSIDLLVRMLAKATDSYYVVYGREDFQTELRNPYYTDIMILGNHSPLTYHYWEELREKVYGGTGLIASLWTEHEAASHETRSAASGRLLGITYTGKLPENALVIRTVRGPVSEKGIIIPGVVAEQVEAMAGTTVAGWFEERECIRRSTALDRREDEDGRDCEDDDWHEQSSLLSSPAIVLDQYGKGKTVFYAFDLGATIGNNPDDRIHDQLSGLVTNSLSYVHTPSAMNRPRPGFLVPIDLKYRSLGSDFDLKISQAYPPALKLLDPSVPAWVIANPWIRLLRVRSAETKFTRYFVLIPDKGGIFTIRTDTRDNGRYPLNSILTTDFVVEQDLKSMAVSVLGLLQGMAPSNNPAVSRALKYVRNVQGRVVLSKKDTEQNISDILLAIEWLLQSNDDLSAVRLMLDELLQGWESRYYFEY